LHYFLRAACYAAINAVRPLPTVAFISVFGLEELSASNAKNPESSGSESRGNNKAAGEYRQVPYAKQCDSILLPPYELSPSSVIVAVLA